MRESNLWQTLSRSMPPGAMAERIENSVGSGMPDTLMTYAGKTVLIELKTDSEITFKQADWGRRWARAGGESWFLIKNNGRLYLVPGDRGHVFIFNEALWRIKDCRVAIEKIFKKKAR